MGEADGWADTREAIRNGGIEYRSRLSTVDGTWVLEAIRETFPVPIGNVWFRFVGNKTIEILHSFVWAEVRRCGLRTKMHESMRSQYPQMKFCTAEGNEMSTPWLEKQGFEQDEVTGDWVLMPKKEG